MTACNVNRVTHCVTWPCRPHLPLYLNGTVGLLGIFVLIVFCTFQTVLLCHSLQSTFFCNEWKDIAKMFIWINSLNLRVPTALPACSSRQHLAGKDGDINQEGPISLLGEAGAPCVKAESFSQWPGFNSILGPLLHFIPPTLSQPSVVTPVHCQLQRIKASWQWKIFKALWMENYLTNIWPILHPVDNPDVPYGNIFYSA